jgi:uncharacterized protein
VKAWIPPLSGLLFGIGLQVSGMTNPAKVKGFLDVFGEWDPSLALVMAGALAVAFTAFRVDARRPAERQVQILCGMNARRVNLSAIGGGALFGIGWGWSGLCPGPALVNLATLQAPFLWFGTGLIASIAAAGLLRRAPKTARPA